MDGPEGSVTRACVSEAHGARIVSDIRSADPGLAIVSRSVVRFLRIDGLEIQGNGSEGHGLVLTCVRRGRYIYNFCLRDIIVEGCGGDGCRMTGNVFEGQVFNAYRSEEHKSELQSLMHHPYAVFCLKKKNHTIS